MKFIIILINIYLLKILLSITITDRGDILKKSSIIVCIAVGLTMGMLFINSSLKPINNVMAYPNSADNSFKNSNEKLYEHTIQSLLHPYIHKVIADYYGQSFPHDPWDDKILSIKGAENKTYFVIKLEVYPYYGPHRTVGIDHVTIGIDAIGNVKVEKFEHVKTIDIPPVPTRP